MPIISQIGRKAWRMRLLIWSIYVILTVGSVTMVYPFMMMLALSFSSRADFQENQVIPRWFYSEDALYRKFTAAKYNEIDIYNRRFNTRYGDFAYAGDFRGLSLAAVNWPHIVAVPVDLDDPVIQARIEDYEDFKRDFIENNPIATECLYRTSRAQSTINLLLERYVDFLLEKYGSLRGINEAYGEENRELREIVAIREQSIFKTYLPPRGVKHEDWAEFKDMLAAEDLEFINIGDIESEWGRYLQSIYGTEERFNEKFGTEYNAFYAVPLPFTLPPPGETEAQDLWRRHWIAFAKERVPLRFMQIQDPHDQYREHLRERHGDLETLNALHETSYGSFDDIFLPEEISYLGTVTNDIYSFILSDRVPPEDITIKSARWSWMDYLNARYETLEAANARHSQRYDDFADVPLPRRLPLGLTDVEQADWREFLTEVMPIEYLLGSFTREGLVAYLQSEYGSAEDLNRSWGTDYSSIHDARMPSAGDLTPVHERDLRRMLAEHYVPLALVVIPEDIPAGPYHDFLEARYGSIDEYNRAIRLYPSWEDVRRPMWEVEWQDYTARRPWLTREFFVGNYRAVVNYMALHGHAFLNTLILCSAMILAALTVNPLCAYALSRFQLSYANSILLFLLATMAFPVAVTQIPNFLLMRDLRLLNTYWALILPGLAHGYSIFLLKGFFDSLPQELFEAGLIDGASEVQMFYRIALPLTKPVLAVIALGAFTLAYGQFMWAFIVCQDPRYWTIMVFLYQFQQDYSVPLVMAGLVLASLPTLVVFVAAQKVILRGIVVPQMK